MEKRARQAYVEDGHEEPVKPPGGTLDPSDDRVLIPAEEHDRSTSSLSPENNKNFVLYPIDQTKTLPLEYVGLNGEKQPTAWGKMKSILDSALPGDPQLLEIGGAKRDATLVSENLKYAGPRAEENAQAVRNFLEYTARNGDKHTTAIIALLHENPTELPEPSRDAQGRLDGDKFQEMLGKLLSKAQEKGLQEKDGEILPGEYLGRDKKYQPYSSTPVAPGKGHGPALGRLRLEYINGVYYRNSKPVCWNSPQGIVANDADAAMHVAQHIHRWNDVSLTGVDGAKGEAFLKKALTYAAENNMTVHNINDDRIQNILNNDKEMSSVKEQLTQKNPVKTAPVISRN